MKALVSVYDKSGIAEFARALHGAGVEMYSTGGTYDLLSKDAGVPVRKVSDLVGFPEILEGRVKTLHPRVHGGLLARRDRPEHMAELEREGIDTIDMVVGNLYPFVETVSRPNVTLEEALENIDIGGPTMIRAAAKNFVHVVPVVDPSDYGWIAERLAENQVDGDGSSFLTLEQRKGLARKAFQHVALYDTAIAAYLGRQDETLFPQELTIGMERLDTLRYGENPHQQAALYGSFLDTIAEQLHGKQLSFNNLVDVQAALALILDFPSSEAAGAAPEHGTTVAILKHNTPCGVGTGDSPLGAYQRAFETDPESPFGGIIVCNRPFDLALAEEIDKIFTEVLVAPGFSDDALALLRKKKNRRLLSFDASKIDRDQFEWRRIFGGVLLQQSDSVLDDLGAAQVVTQAQPTPEQLSALEFAWRVVKHVKSNAVVFGAEGRTLAVGGGCTSRVDAVHAAAAKAARTGVSLEGSVLASDAFFPFPDGLETAVEAGARAVIQPGGSKGDEQVIEAADRLGISMVFTGVRHFRH